MTKPKKHATLKTALALTAINLLAFILTYLSSYVSDSAFLIYLSIFASDFLTAAFPVAIAAIATVIYTRCGTQAAFIHGTALVASRAIYFYPLAYLDYIAAGYITIEALLLSVLNTILSLIVIYLEAMLISILILFLTGKIARKKGDKKSSLAELTVVKDPFDFSKPAPIAYFSGAAVPFLILLIYEIVSTVGFLRNFQGSYRASEIVYMSFRYVFILITLLLSHFIAYAAKNLWIDKCISADTVKRTQRNAK